MAVLVEGLSVVVRMDSIESRLAGAWKRFESLVPNATLCEDGELARVGFMSPAEVRDFVDQLTQLGLTFFLDGQMIDIVVCDQQQGPTSECDWIEFGRLPVEGGEVSAVWLFEGQRKAAGLHMQHMKLVVPPGWQFKDSLSDKFHFIPDDASSH